MLENEMLESLRTLTKIRRDGLGDSLTNGLREIAGQPPLITFGEMFQMQEELEAQLKNWYVIWDDNIRCYGVIPRVISQ